MIRFPDRSIYRVGLIHKEFRREVRTEDKDSNAFYIGIIIKYMNL